MEPFMSDNMFLLKRDYPRIYENLVDLKEVVYEDNVLSDKTLKLISIALTAAAEDRIGTRKQINSGIREYGITREEVMDVLKVVLLLCGKPAFTKAVGIIYDETGE